MQNDITNLFFIRHRSVLAILHSATPTAARFCSDAFAACSNCVKWQLLHCCTKQCMISPWCNNNLSGYLFIRKVQYAPWNETITLMFQSLSETSDRESDREVLDGSHKWYTSNRKDSVLWTKMKAAAHTTNHFLPRHITKVARTGRRTEQASSDEGLR